MGILDRLGSIIKSNVNDALDKAEDPAKMVDQTLRDLREDLAKVKRETANVMAEETRCKNQLDECTAKIAKIENAAKNALKSGDEAAARTLLENKQSLVNTQASLQQSYDVAHANAVNIRKAHDKLVADINDMENRKESIKAKVSVAKAQQHVNEVTKGIGSTSSLEAFDRMEAKADKMLNQANAEAELNKSMEDSNADSLINKYSGVGSAEVDDEMARLKAELGM